MSDDRCDLLCLDLPTAERLRLRRREFRVAEAAAGKAHALSDPTRLTLAAALLEADELCVCDLAWIVERAQNLVSHHARTLRAHGVVRSRRQGKMVMYSLTDEGRTLVDAVLTAARPTMSERVGV
ncbi:MAG: helix-turn-helix transcriptional regulator [Actinobacteria bacterium]|nr:MAG: helix-turn-helix transcriptional regulator [Actinomycetota bacterium]TML67819.1 MAG: helix-turn-helix transcriptional regulator [Actinomycetota bacterium]